MLHRGLSQMWRCNNWTYLEAPDAIVKLVQMGIGGLDEVPISLLVSRPKLDPAVFCRQFPSNAQQ